MSAKTTTGDRMVAARMDHERLLKTTLEEEKKTDQALSALAETCVNLEAESEAA
jgi:ferritin-like metal-binding protein YciE